MHLVQLFCAQREKENSWIFFLLFRNFRSYTSGWIQSLCIFKSWILYNEMFFFWGLTKTPASPPQPHLLFHKNDSHRSPSSKLPELRTIFQLRPPDGVYLFSSFSHKVFLTPKSRLVTLEKQHIPLYPPCPKFTLWYISRYENTQLCSSRRRLNKRTQISRLISIRFNAGNI